MKEVAVQTVSDTSVSPQVLSKTPLPEYEFPQILYKAHTVLWLQALVVFLSYFTYTRTDDDTGKNLKLGILFAIFTFVFISAVHLPNSVYLSRPHPVFWRMLQGLSYVYLTLLVFVLFQNVNDTRGMLKLIDNDLGKPLPEREYAKDCEVFTPDHPESYFFHLKQNIFDFYVIAHSIGWWLKMLIVRDVKLCLFLSALFEFLEISLQHQLPNFKECWWDSLILDFIICNGGGIFLGWLTCRAFEVKEYYWGMGDDNRSRNEKFNALTRSAEQLTPYSWYTYKWEMFTSSKNFVTTVWYITFVNLVDLGYFYLKFLLWIPPNHWIIVSRVGFWAIFAIASTREYYEYVSSGFKIRLGAHCWTAHVMIAVEWMIVFKNSEGLFSAQAPLWLSFIWSLVAAFLVGTGLCLFYKDLSKK
jgi:phosphatidylserine synthase 2